MSTVPQTKDPESTAPENLKSPPPLDAAQLLQTIRGIAETASAAQHNPPAHIMVTCGNDKVAFGREALMQMGYDKARDAMLNEFAINYLEVTMFATFWRLHGVGDEGSARIHQGSWMELLPDVKQINLVEDPPE